jgi:hypothetical protein
LIGKLPLGWTTAIAAAQAARIAATSATRDLADGC